MEYDENLLRLEIKPEIDDDAWRNYNPLTPLFAEYGRMSPFKEPPSEQKVILNPIVILTRLDFSNVTDTVYLSESQMENELTDVSILSRKRRSSSTVTEGMYKEFKAPRSWCARRNRSSKSRYRNNRAKKNRQTFDGCNVPTVEEVLPPVGENGYVDICNSTSEFEVESVVSDQVVDVFEASEDNNLQILPEVNSGRRSKRQRKPPGNRNFTEVYQVPYDELVVNSNVGPVDDMPTDFQIHSIHSDFPSNVPVSKPRVIRKSSGKRRKIVSNNISTFTNENQNFSTVNWEKDGINEQEKLNRIDVGICDSTYNLEPGYDNQSLNLGHYELQNECNFLNNEELRDKMVLESRGGLEMFKPRKQVLRNQKETQLTSDTDFQRDVPISDMFHDFDQEKPENSTVDLRQILTRKTDCTELLEPPKKHSRNKKKPSRYDVPTFEVQSTSKVVENYLEYQIPNSNIAENFENSAVENNNLTKNDDWKKSRKKRSYASVKIELSNSNRTPVKISTDIFGKKSPKFAKSPSEIGTSDKISPNKNESFVAAKPTVDKPMSALEMLLRDDSTSKKIEIKNFNKNSTKSTKSPNKPEHHLNENKLISQINQKSRALLSRDNPCTETNKNEIISKSESKFATNTKTNHDSLSRLNKDKYPRRTETSNKTENKANKQGNQNSIEIQLNKTSTCSTSIDSSSIETNKKEIISQAIEDNHLSLSPINQGEYPRNTKELNTSNKANKPEYQNLNEINWNSHSIIFSKSSTSKVTPCIESKKNEGILKPECKFDSRSTKTLKTPTTTEHLETPPSEMSLVQKAALKRANNQKLRKKFKKPKLRVVKKNPPSVKLRRFIPILNNFYLDRKKRIKCYFNESVITSKHPFFQDHLVLSDNDVQLSSPNRYSESPPSVRKLPSDTDSQRTVSISDMFHDFDQEKPDNLIVDLRQIITQKSEQDFKWKEPFAVKRPPNRPKQKIKQEVVETGVGPSPRTLDWVASLPDKSQQSTEDDAISIFADPGLLPNDEELDYEEFEEDENDNQPPSVEPQQDEMLVSEFDNYIPPPPEFTTPTITYPYPTYNQMPPMSDSIYPYPNLNPKPSNPNHQPKKPKQVSKPPAKKPPVNDVITGMFENIPKLATRKSDSAAALDEIEKQVINRFVTVKPSAESVVDESDPFRQSVNSYCFRYLEYGFCGNTHKKKHEIPKKLESELSKLDHSQIKYTFNNFVSSYSYFLEKAIPVFAKYFGKYEDKDELFKMIGQIQKLKIKSREKTNLIEVTVEALRDFMQFDEIIDNIVKMGPTDFGMIDILLDLVLKEPLIESNWSLVRKLTHVSGYEIPLICVETVLNDCQQMKKIRKIYIQNIYDDILKNLADINLSKIKPTYLVNFLKLLEKYEIKDASILKSRWENVLKTLNPVQNLPTCTQTSPEPPKPSIITPPKGPQGPPITIPPQFPILPNCNMPPPPHFVNRPSIPPPRVDHPNFIKPNNRPQPYPPGYNPQYFHPLAKPVGPQTSRGSTSQQYTDSNNDKRSFNPKNNFNPSPNFKKNNKNRSGNRNQNSRRQQFPSESEIWSFRQCFLNDKFAVGMHQLNRYRYRPDFQLILNEVALGLPNEAANIIKSRFQR